VVHAIDSSPPVIKNVEAVGKPHGLVASVKVESIFPLQSIIFVGE
jgi:hypothetical protein